MKKLIVCASLFGMFNVNAQSDVTGEITSLRENVENIRKENLRLNAEVRKLSNSLSVATSDISSLKKSNDSLNSAISAVSVNVNTGLADLNRKSQGKFAAVSDSISKNSLYSVIGILAALLISGLLYWVLSRKQKSDAVEFSGKLDSTKASLQESLLDEYGKQTALMQSQLEILEKQKVSTPAAGNTEPDHSLALKLASEINLLQRNISLMDQGTKGLKQLNRSVEKLKDNLAANGYEIPELLGKEFHQGMKVIVASSIPDENLEKGSEIITKVLIPQVNYNDKMIQTAQLEVSVGY